jgi:hypothetical protein
MVHRRQAAGGASLDGGRGNFYAFVDLGVEGRNATGNFVEFLWIQEPIVGRFFNIATSELWWLGPSTWSRASSSSRHQCSIFYYTPLKNMGKVGLEPT